MPVSLKSKMSEPSSASMSAIFTSHLPTLPTTSSTGDEFARAMLDYLAAFKTHRDAAGIHYESSPEYQNAQFTLMRVPATQLWPYTPHFKKCMAVALQTLFKTEISRMSSSQASIDQLCVFVDENRFRWIMVIEQDALDADLNRVYLYFPRANTVTNMTSTDTTSNLIADNSLATKGLAILTTDITHWTAGT